MKDNQKELNHADLIQCIGLPFDQQTVFAESYIVNPSSSIVEEYHPSIVSKSIKTPGHFKLFGIQTDEIHFALNSNNKILAVFVKLDNKDLIDKMAKVIGTECIAIGNMMADEDLPPSYYLWDYAKGCISLYLVANRSTMWIPKSESNEALVTFFNCNPTSYSVFGEIPLD